MPENDRNSQTGIASNKFKKKFDKRLQSWYQSRSTPLNDSRAVSSTRQSTWLLISRLKVRFLHGPPIKSRLSGIYAESLFYWISSNLVKLHFFAVNLRSIFLSNISVKFWNTSNSSIHLPLNPSHNQRDNLIDHLTQHPPLSITYQFEMHPRQHVSRCILKFPLIQKILKKFIRKLDAESNGTYYSPSLK